MIIKCIEDNDSINFKVLLNIFLNIGETTLDQTKNLSALVTKILSSKNKTEFLYQIFTSL